MTGFQLTLRATRCIPDRVVTPLSLSVLPALTVDLRAPNIVSWHTRSELVQTQRVFAWFPLFWHFVQSSTNSGAPEYPRDV